MVFVEKEVKVRIQGDTKHFFLVVLPDSRSTTWVTLSNRVRLKGKKGYVPGINVIQRIAKLPWFHYRVKKVKGKTMLSHFTITFRRFQVIDGKLQWIVRTLDDIMKVAVAPTVSITSAAFVLPEGKRIWTGQGLDAEFIEQGFLLKMPIFSPLVSERVARNVANSVPSS